MIQLIPEKDAEYKRLYSIASKRGKESGYSGAVLFAYIKGYNIGYNQVSQKINDEENLRFISIGVQEGFSFEVMSKFTGWTIKKIKEVIKEQGWQ